MNNKKDIFTPALVFFALTISVLTIYNYGKPIDVTTSIKDSELNKFKGFVLQEDEKIRDSLFFLYSYKCEYCADINTNLYYLSSLFKFIRVKYVPLNNEIDSHRIKLLGKIFCLENKNNAKIIHDRLFSYKEHSKFHLPSINKQSCVNRRMISESLRNNFQIIYNNDINSVPVLVYKNKVYVGYQNLLQILLIILLK